MDFDPSLAAPPCVLGKMQFLPKQKWSAAATLSGSYKGGKKKKQPENP